MVGRGAGESRVRGTWDPLAGVACSVGSQTVSDQMDIPRLQLVLILQQATLSDNTAAQLASQHTLPNIHYKL